MRLIEREALLARLQAWLEQARTTGRLALVGGEAGVGKTSLARSFVETCPDSFRVLWGACDPLSTPRPLAPFHDIAPFAALLRKQRGGHGLLTALLGELTVHSVMVVEDAHWADEATLDALRFIGRRVTGTRSVVLVTYRDDEVGAGHPLRAVLGDLSTAAGCERLHVPVLTPAGVRILAAGHALDPERLHRVTGGNAFYVTEVLAAPGWIVPLSVTDAVLARVSRLSSGARGLIDLVSMAPGGLEPEIAARLIDGAGAALDEAVERGVLVLAGTRVSFRHELARLAIDGTVAPGRRRELHARLLEALEARSGTDPARLAHHADAAGNAERVLQYAPVAAREASIRGAHREAARQYERAVAQAGELPVAEIADLLFLWAEERIGFDEPADLAALLERIVELRRQCGDARGLGASLALLARPLWAMGRIRDAFERVAEAVEILEPLPPGPELARAYAAYSLQAMLARRGGEAVLWGSRAVELAERVGAPAALRMALNSIGSAQLMCFEQPEGIEALERAMRLAAADGDDFEVGRALGNLGAALEEIRQYERAAAYLERAVSFDGEHDLDGLAGPAKANLAKVRFEQGSWDEADRLAIEALRHRGSICLQIVALSVRGRIRARRGDPEAESFLDQAWALTSHTGELQCVWPAAAGRAESAWLAGRAADIARFVKPTYEQARALGVRWAIGELGSWLVRAQALDRLPGDAALPYTLPWREAAEAWRRIGCPYEQAEALADGDEAAMRESLAILTRLGAEPAADRVREKLRRAGVKRVPARPRASTRSAPAQLTRRQLEVLALVESGLSNAEIARRLFISEKTAIHHVSAILRKLGAGTRGEAAAAARKMGIPATPT
jgi:DNA-binding CsgD family transcriptional regulator/tetratricopeptide (TPR) repeat protein